MPTSRSDPLHTNRGASGWNQHLVTRAELVTYTYYHFLIISVGSPRVADADSLLQVAEFSSKWRMVFHLRGGS